MASCGQSGFTLGGQSGSTVKMHKIPCADVYHALRVLYSKFCAPPSLAKASSTASCSQQIPVQCTNSLPLLHVLFQPHQPLPSRLEQRRIFAEGESEESLADTGVVFGVKLR